MADNRLISVIISFITCTKSVLSAKITQFQANDFVIFNSHSLYLIAFVFLLYDNLHNDVRYCHYFNEHYVPNKFLPY